MVWIACAILPWAAGRLVSRINIGSDLRSDLLCRMLRLQCGGATSTGTVRRQLHLPSLPALWIAAHPLSVHLPLSRAPTRLVWPCLALAALSCSARDVPVPGCSPCSEPCLTALDPPLLNPPFPTPHPPCSPAPRSAGGAVRPAPAGGGRAAEPAAEQAVWPATPADNEPGRGWGQGARLRAMPPPRESRRLQLLLLANHRRAVRAALHPHCSNPRRSLTPVCCALWAPARPCRLQRDVPGLTRAAIPILARQGVRVLTVGVNGVSAPPAVPFNTPFWWRDEPSGSQLLSFWHPGARGGPSAAVRYMAVGSRPKACGSRAHEPTASMPGCGPAVLWRPADRHRRGALHAPPTRCAMPCCAALCRVPPAGGYSGDPVDRRDKCVHAAGSRTRLCLSWTHDNTGPPHLSTVLDIFKRVRPKGAAPCNLQRAELGGGDRGRPAGCYLLHQPPGALPGAPSG